MQLSLILSVCLLAVQLSNGSSLPKFELHHSTKLFYKDKDGSSITISNPERPTLKEITYYHLVEKPYPHEDADLEGESDESSPSNEAPPIDQRKDKVDDILTINKTKQESRKKREVWSKPQNRFKRAYYTGWVPSEFPGLVKDYITADDPPSVFISLGESNYDDYYDPIIEYEPQGNINIHPILPIEIYNEKDKNKDTKKDNNTAKINSHRESAASQASLGEAYHNNYNEDNSLVQNENAESHNNYNYYECDENEASQSSSWNEHHNYNDDNSFIQNGHNVFNGNYQGGDINQGIQNGGWDDHHNVNAGNGFVNNQQGNYGGTQIDSAGGHHYVNNDHTSTDNSHGNNSDDCNESYESALSILDEILQGLYKLFGEHNCKIDSNPGAVDILPNISIPNCIRKLIVETASPEILNSDPNKAMYSNVLKQLFANIIKNDINGHSDTPVNNNNSPVVTAGKDNIDESTDNSGSSTISNDDKPLLYRIPLEHNKEKTDNSPSEHISNPDSSDSTSKYNQKIAVKEPIDADPLKKKDENSTKSNSESVKADAPPLNKQIDQAEVQKKLDQLMDLLNNGTILKMVTTIAVQYLESLKTSNNSTVEVDPTSLEKKYLDLDKTPKLEKEKDDIKENKSTLEKNDVPISENSQNIKKEKDDIKENISKSKKNDAPISENSEKIEQTQKAYPGHKQIDSVPDDKHNTFEHIVDKDKVTNVYVFYNTENIDEIIKYIHQSAHKNPDIKGQNTEKTNYSITEQVKHESISITTEPSAKLHTNKVTSDVDITTKDLDNLKKNVSENKEVKESTEKSDIGDKTSDLKDKAKSGEPADIPNDNKTSTAAPESLVTAV